MQVEPLGFSRKVSILGRIRSPESRDAPPGSSAIPPTPTTQPQAATEPDPAVTGEKKAYDSLLGRLDALRVLRADDEAEKGVLLEELAELGAAERDIARELLGVRPLAQPDRFEEAHRSVIRALEVLERNGGRRATVTGLGPLNSPACFVVTLVAGWIARQHRFALVRQLGRLYEAREANTTFGSPEHRMLRRARDQAASPGDGGWPRHLRVRAASLSCA